MNKAVNFAKDHTGKNYLNMRGISPVIASMLIIVIAIVLLTLVYSWLLTWQQIQTAKETIKIRNITVDKIRISGVQLDEVSSTEKYIEYLYLNNLSNHDLNSIYVFVDSNTICSDLDMGPLDNLVLNTTNCPDINSVNIGNDNVLITAASTNGKHAVYINTLLGKI